MAPAGDARGASAGRYVKVKQRTGRTRTSLRSARANHIVVMTDTWPVNGSLGENTMESQHIFSFLLITVKTIAPLIMTEVVMTEMMMALIAAVKIFHTGSSVRSLNSPPPSFRARPPLPPLPPPAAKTRMAV